MMMANKHYRTKKGLTQSFKSNKECGKGQNLVVAGASLLVMTVLPLKACVLASLPPQQSSLILVTNFRRSSPNSRDCRTSSVRFEGPRD